MRLAHFGTFDVQNYGDLLFPLVVESKLSDLFDEIVHVSPLGGRRVYSDVPVSIGTDEARDLDVDAVLIGGGNILHASWTDLPSYRSVQYRAYPDLWLTASSLAERCGVPLGMNAPGAPSDFRGSSARALSAMAERVGYFNVRDEYSRRRVTAAGVQDVHVVPDSALQISEVLDRGELDRLGAGASGDEYMAVHVNGRYTAADAAALAAMLDEMSARSGMRACLIGIGPCHGDDVLAREIARHMASDPLLYADPSHVTQIAAVIRDAKLYVGSSLHGFITASSFGVPAILVADHRKQSKFRGLLDQLAANDRMVESWESVSRLIAEGSALLIEGADVEDARNSLDVHWARIRRELLAESPTADRLGRGDHWIGRIATNNRVEASARRAARRALKLARLR